VYVLLLLLVYLSIFQLLLHRLFVFDIFLAVTCLSCFFYIYIISYSILQHRRPAISYGGIPVAGNNNKLKEMDEKEKDRTAAAATFFSLTSFYIL
jgi:hypothetical protein